jgi:glycosyltransferase involved in cell wall biosynthesis
MIPTRPTREKMSVAMLIHGYHPLVGGAERQLGALAPRLIQHGMDVQVLTRRHAGLAREQVIEGVPVHRLPIPGPKPLAALAFIVAAIRRIGRIRPQVIHAHELFSTTTAAVIAKALFHIPVVVTPHSSGPRGDVQRLKRKLFGSWRMSLFRRWVDAFIVISTDISQELAQAEIPANRCHFIPNGVDIDRYQPSSTGERGKQRARLGINEKELLAVFTGRLVPLKRVEDLLGAWLGVRSHFPAARLLILGSGPQEKVLRARAGEGVNFLGNVGNVVEYLKVADLFVLPSSIEGLSVALLEAMACGLPVLATSVGGNVDLIKHAQNGWLVPPGQIVALQAAIIRLLGDGELRARLGSQARQTVMHQYGLEQMVDSLMDVYQNLGGEPL